MFARGKQHPDPLWLNVMDIRTGATARIFRSTSEIKPENQSMDVPLTTDSTSGTQVRSALDYGTARKSIKNH